jgi:putative serine protease PepD
MVSRRGRRCPAPAAFLALIVAAAVAVAACGSGSGNQASQAVPGQDSYERVIKMVLPSVVQVDAGKSTGSGVVFDTRGDVVTNAHVVAGAKGGYRVVASASARPLDARVIGSFAPDDLAVIRVTSGAATLRPVRWADSNRAQVGQLVLAMGSPYGLIDSVTQGIISATGRTVTGPKIGAGPASVITDALQTSAPINPGNSGGALVDLTGAVLGIPTLEARNPDLGGAADGIGFAIPSNTVRGIAGQLIRKGHVTTSDRASLQVTGSTHANHDGNADGVAVDAAQPGGAAAAAGIRAGDIILSIGRSKTETEDDLDDVLIDYKPGDQVKVAVLRGGKREQFVVRLGSLSSRP